MTKKSRDRRGMLRCAKSIKYYGEVKTVSIEEVMDLGSETGNGIIQFILNNPKKPFDGNIII